MVNTGAEGINGGIAAAEEGWPGGVTIYVEVEDLEEYLRDGPTPRREDRAASQ